VGHLKKQELLQSLSVEESEWMLKIHSFNRYVAMGTEVFKSSTLCSLVGGYYTGSCEHSNGILGSKKGREFLE
jgi:hypothetical protein